MEFDFAKLEVWHWMVLGGAVLLILVQGGRYLLRMSRFVVTGSETRPAEVAVETQKIGLDRLFFDDDR